MFFSQHLSSQHLSSQHFWSWGSQPKHVSNPASISLTPVYNYGCFSGQSAVLRHGDSVALLGTTPANLRLKYQVSCPFRSLSACAATAVTGTATATPHTNGGLAAMSHTRNPPAAKRSRIDAPAPTGRIDAPAPTQGRNYNIAPLFQNGAKKRAGALAPTKVKVAAQPVQKRGGWSSALGIFINHTSESCCRTEVRTIRCIYLYIYLSIYTHLALNTYPPPWCPIFCFGFFFLEFYYYYVSSFPSFGE